MKERSIQFEKDLEFECNDNLAIFGYKSKAAFNACMQRYEKDYKNGKNILSSSILSLR